jgi:hypothetical protein
MTKQTENLIYEIDEMIAQLESIKMELESL